MDLISVIIPVYNIEAYLPECVESVIHQTYPNLEIILVDDGSTDSSGQICDRYQKDDVRIKVIHKENGGLSDARNAGMDMAGGRFFSFVDGDDRIAVDMIEILYRALADTQSDLAFGVTQKDSGGNYANRDDGNTKIISGKDILNAFIYPEFTPHILKTVWDKLYRKELIDDLRFIKGIHGEDGPFTLQVLSRCSKCVFIGKTLYYYRDVRDGSITGQGITERFFTDKIPIMKRQIQFLEEQQRTDLAGYQTCCYFELLLNAYVRLSQRPEAEAIQWSHRLRKLLQKERGMLLGTLKKRKVPQGYKRRVVLFLINPELLCLLKRIKRAG